MGYIEDLWAFVEVADQGSFTRAAEALDDFLGNARARVLNLVG